MKNRSFTPSSGCLLQSGESSLTLPPLGLAPLNQWPQQAFVFPLSGPPTELPSSVSRSLFSGTPSPSYHPRLLGLLSSLSLQDPIPSPPWPKAWAVTHTVVSSLFLSGARTDFGPFLAGRKGDEGNHSSLVQLQGQTITSQPGLSQ